jgi:PLP dependent protein
VSVPDPRRTEIAANLAAVRETIADACRKADRDPSEVTLIAVTKTYPASDVRLLADLGVLDVGENRDQEASPKAAETAGLGLRWHFIGQLQTNKAASVVGYASHVHSVDRIRLVSALSKARIARASAEATSSSGGQPGGRPGSASPRPDSSILYDNELTCLIQVDLGNSAPMEEHVARGGASPDQVPAIADAIAEAPGLRLGGLMAVAPLGADPAEAFERLHRISTRLRADHPSATMISAGMSGDAAEAIAAGATHVRIGGAILGIRK